MISRRQVLRTGALSTAMLPLARSRTLALLQSATRAEQDAVLAPRERFLLDFGWKFTLGNLSDPAKDLGFNGSHADFSKSGTFSFATEKFDDSHWRNVNIPHDWAVDLPFVHDDRLEAQGYKPLGRSFPDTSVGWYRRSFELSQSDQGRRVTLQFDGTLRNALVFLNGYYVGSHDDGYTPFHIDITDYVNYSGRNVLVVRMDASAGDGWFYEGAGIYRHVWLTKTDPLHIAPWETVVRSELRGEAATLALETVVRNDLRVRANDVKVRWKILDPGGKTVATALSSAGAVEAGEQATFFASARLTNVAFWSPETPVLYRAVATVESAGKTLDAEPVDFGVRTLRFDADHGFFLNGKHTLIKGTCNHQDHAGVGAALPDRLQWYRLALLKSMGSNAVRTSHNMPTPEWVEACDQMGMMMMCETRTMSSSPEGLAMYATMVKRFRNSPSIILWSIGNEEWVLQGAAQGKRVAASMIALSHKLDPTRLCTAAVNGNYTAGISDALDVEGFNYNLKSIDAYHKAHPHRPLVGSETASTLSARGIYETDKLRNWVSAYDVNTTDWSETAEQWWQFYAERDFLPGGFAWTGFDYRGEPTPYAWPSINSEFGILDTCGFPKDNFFYYKAWWSNEPVLHLFPHWNWEERLGEPVDVWVHSNLDEVELLLNGKSQGRQKVVPLSHLSWKVKYEPGVIEAHGFKGGKLVLSEKRETTGGIVAIGLSADRTTIHANGEDLAIIRVEGLDAQGRTVPSAGDFIQFRVTGAGTLLGVGNGDPNCVESDKVPRRSLFNGLAELIVQAGVTPGALLLEAYTEDFPGPKLPVAQLTITTQASTRRKAI